MFSFTFFFPFTVALSWSNPWLHCQDSSNEAGWCSEVICCNVVIICCWIINRAPSTIPGETTNTVEFEMSGRSPWWWWWRHQVRQLSRGWLSQTCPCSRKLHHRMIHSLSLFQSLMKYGWVESIFRWLWRQVNLRNLWGGSEVELLIKDGREERNGLSFTKGREQSVGVRPRRLGSSDMRRKDDDLFRSELKSKVCRFRVTFKPRALLYSSFFIAFFVFAQVGSVGAGRPGHLLCLAGIRWINTRAGERFPLNTRRG